MGEVYRAKDTRLDRTVAIKILPVHLSSNPVSKQRFDREARTISNLSHPYICALHDVGHQDGVDFLVMEFLEGETLAQRLSKGPLTTELVFRYGIQIADALDKAHKQGIVHRDLKPGNIMITKTGAKLLDFGLAKLCEKQPEVDSSVSQVVTHDHLTEEGIILGTVQYMAPEQLEGKEADPRTDIFALGEIIYEMVTGQKPFTGQGKASLISAILTSDPRPISAGQPLSPQLFDHVVKKCLAKDPDDRWQSARDLASELKWILEAPTTARAATPMAKRRLHLFQRSLWVFLFFIIAAAGWIAYFNRSSAPQKLMQLSISAPADHELVDAPAVSPDGSRIVFPAADKNGKVNLWVRTLDSSNATLIPGTRGVSRPFWSADSRSVGFFAGGKLMKVHPSEGHAQALCEVSDDRGGTWNQHGVILFSPHPGDGLYRISSSGGVPTRVTSLDASAEESSHRLPYFLPDGNHFLFFIKAQKGESGIYVSSLDSQKKSFLLKSDRSAVFSSGYLLFQRSNTLLAQAFDPKGLKLTGEAVPLFENAWYESVTWGSRGLAVSDGNLLAYVEGSNLSNLLWFDRSGNQQGFISSPDQYVMVPSFSPDGNRFIIRIVDGGSSHLWLYSSSSGGRSKLTFTPSNDSNPRWSPDGTRILFNSDRAGPYKLYLKNAGGAGKDELLYQTKNWCISEDWSNDGQYILFSEVDPKTKYDLWAMQLRPLRKAFPFLVTDANEANARFSPDGKWVAYCSDESGQAEVYVQPFLSDKGGKWQVSTNGGYNPKWSKDGKELFYLSPDNQIMSSKIRLAPSFEAVAPTALFMIHPYAIPRIGLGNGADAFEPAPDGQRFAVHAPLTSSSPNISVVVNWPLLLNHKKYDQNLSRSR